MKSSVITSLLRQANYSVRILKAIWEAVQMACSTAGKNQDVDNAFESLSDLLRGYSNKGFVLSIEGFVVFSTPYAVYLLILCSLEQAKRRDEQTLKLFGHFSAKYDRNKVARLICGLLYINGPPQPIKFNEKKEKHLFSIRNGNRKAIIESGSYIDTCTLSEIFYSGGGLPTTSSRTSMAIEEALQQCDTQHSP